MLRGLWRWFWSGSGIDRVPAVPPIIDFECRYFHTLDFDTDVTHTVDFTIAFTYIIDIELNYQ